MDEQESIDLPVAFNAMYYEEIVLNVCSVLYFTAKFKKKQKHCG